MIPISCKNKSENKKVTENLVTFPKEAETKNNFPDTYKSRLNIIIGKYRLKTPTWYNNIKPNKYCTDVIS